MASFQAPCETLNSLRPMAGRKRRRVGSPEHEHEIIEHEYVTLEHVSGSPQHENKRQAPSIGPLGPPTCHTATPSNKQPITLPSTRPGLEETRSSPSNPLGSYNTWSCPKCGRHCWLCRLSSAAPLEQLKPVEGNGEDMSHTGLSSGSTPSISEVSSAPASTTKRKAAFYAEHGKTPVLPREKGFAKRILRELAVKPDNSSPPKSTLSTLLKSEVLNQF